MQNRLSLNIACWSWLALLALVGPTSLACATADESGSQCPITVYLSGGRSFTAALDARTDSAQLWLRFAAARAEILRPIDWNHVVSAELAGERLSGQQLRQLVEQLRQEIPAQPVTPAARTSIVMIGSPDVEQPVAEKGTVPVCAKHPPGRCGIWGQSPFPPGSAAETRQVVSVAIDACVGRWDENVDPDGLLVRVYPLDAQGAIVPLHGTLNVDLKVEQRGIELLRQPFVDAGHWAQAVRPADFGPTGAVCRLRFQGLHPEFEDRVRSPGSVHASLAVPGQGTFEASTYVSFVRPFNPVRDRLQAITRHGYFPGYRYFPDERTDDGRR